MHRPLLAASVLALTAAASSADAARSLTEYRAFRATSVDLAGRLPTRAELAAFEKPDFDLDKWIDARLTGKAYAERIRRAYMDLLRLDVGPTFTFRPNTTVLRRQTILGPDGTKQYVYYRNGQRRSREATDGVFCLTKAEAGAAWTTAGVQFGDVKPVDAATLAANTVTVKPWWLGAEGWAAPELLTDPDGTKTTEVRICKEEASTATSGVVYWTGRKAPAAGTPFPYERVQALPLDDTYANLNKGKTVACDSGTAVSHTLECGCGPNLERCMPSAGNGVEPIGFMLPGGTMLGSDRPTSTDKVAASAWDRLWWNQEAVRTLEWIAAEDRDFREVLTGTSSMMNGPLVQFYKHQAPATCCGNGYSFAYDRPQGLVDPSRLPALGVVDTGTWKATDRGPLAAGILTMPVFLAKYGTRRARAHVLYNVFQCREFVAEAAKLEPSTEPDLTKRSGCATCHASLEPMAAYFSRVLESDWTYLPAAQFPVDNDKCKADPLKMTTACKQYYDPAFTSTSRSTLRGAYASAANADAGPSGLAKAMVSSPDFASCVVENMGTSFLGRALGPDDAAMRARLEKEFVAGGYKMRSLVRALVREAAYRTANNLTSAAWREQEGK